jgi:hypothetical protein
VHRVATPTLSLQLLRARQRSGPAELAANLGGRLAVGRTRSQSDREKRLLALSPVVEPAPAAVEHPSPLMKAWALQDRHPLLLLRSTHLLPQLLVVVRAGVRVLALRPLLGAPALFGVLLHRWLVREQRPCCPPRCDPLGNARLQRMTLRYVGKERVPHACALPLVHSWAPSSSMSPQCVTCVSAHRVLLSPT